MTAGAIYLDNNATTPLDPRVLEAMTRAWTDGGANPGSQHALGRKARRLLEDAREGTAALLGAKTGGMDADHLIFTSGGTEANNLVLFGLNAHSAAAAHSAVIVSALEHASILAAAEELKRLGHTVRSLPVRPDGTVDFSPLNHLGAAAPPRLVSVMLANNETGVLQPVREIVQLCTPLDIPVHTDAAQAIGKVAVHFRDLGVAAMTIAPHKFHGPLGVGALLLRHGTQLQPLLFGGFQQQGHRPGTENVALAVGLFETVRLATQELAARAARLQALRDKLEQQLQEAFPDLVIIGEQSSRLPHTSCLAFPGVDRQALIMALDLAGVACSTGSACASGSSEPSPTLLAMGFPDDVLSAAFRLSLGAFTTELEVAEAARRIMKVVKHLKQPK